MIRKLVSLLRFFKTYIKTINVKKDLNFPLMKGNDLCIVMNGPSFKSEYEENSEYLKKTNIMCSNHFAKTDLYQELQPNFYILADSAFWKQIEGGAENLQERIAWVNKVCKETVDAIIEKTKWKLNLFLPESSKQNSAFLERLKTNSNISLIFYNSYEYSGPEKFKFSFWEKQKCCPVVCNVLIGAIYLGLVMKFDNVYLYGADHNFFSNLKVDEDNNVYECNEHFYKDKNKQVKASNPEGTKENIGSLLSIYAKMWNTYYELEAFAEINQVNVINCTQTSMIDAFRRKKNEL